LKNGGSQVGYAALNINGEYGGYAIEPGYTIAVSEKEKNFLITPEYYLR